MIARILRLNRSYKVREEANREGRDPITELARGIVRVTDTTVPCWQHRTPYTIKEIALAHRLLELEAGRAADTKDPHSAQISHC